MEKVIVKVPGSCGEWIQGFYGGPECLISYAIDCYSKVTIEKSSFNQIQIDHENEKAAEAYEMTCGLLGLDPTKYQISIESDIPIGKGMASSTADIVGVLAALATIAGKPLDPNWLATKAASIEPTDNTMFEKWVLFDHLKGQVIKTYDCFGDLSVVVLEMEEVIDTKALRKTGAFSKNNKPNPSASLSYFEEAVRTQSFELLGKAMHVSALENQGVLEKPFLKELIELSKKHEVIGVNTSHSGSVLGIVFKTSDDPEAFLEEADQCGYLKPYLKQHIHKIIKGGPIIETV